MIKLHSSPKARYPVATIVCYAIDILLPAGIYFIINPNYVPAQQQNKHNGKAD